MVALLVPGLLLLSAPAGRAAEVPVPTVEEIAPDAGVKGNPYNALPEDLAEEAGYDEREYLVSGTASARNLSPVALVSAGAAPEGVSAPYSTRILVRVPDDPSRFNGTVVAEWLNVTSGYDVEASWSQLHRQLIRSGYGYVGITAQEVGAVGLKAFDAVRYAEVVHPGDQFAYDVFAQAVKAVRDSEEIDLPVQRVIATGASQSGSTLNTYINEVEPEVENLIDGFLVLTSTRLLENPEVPVLRLLTEGEAGAGYQDGNNFREWEVAGATHTDTHDGAYFDRTHSRDWAENWPLTPRDMTFPQECRIGSMPKFFVAHAALEALAAWIETETPPAPAPRIPVAEDGTLERDPVTGNTVGGIRTPAVDVPTATYFGDKDDCAPTMGKTVFWDQARIDARYPSAAEFEIQVRASAESAVANGFLLAEDIEAVVAQSLSGLSP